ncbi:MAG: hypothetical protein COX62_07885 [Deltaproteobacteria bacterium CG_4_10_14_0_2_um_filter_43_8]|nr:MAG: hypothetical protein COV43_05310 [Deltaproteobacteria bacterium CG11_big_fil_rev_8_21_14_0_20_42_23]PJA18870.1 MAG: hypothetical protein COX62_07885 [Deltaproteobacteria bacterium CG_4_10_14_0_2_um_filter_43_8]PJC64010.1 MAG: hypothetical protein CO021_06285 [Deltaproteobacteria bacterium CG_4_9_14_0_2_um_filter_42_21]
MLKGSKKFFYLLLTLLFFGGGACVAGGIEVGSTTTTTTTSSSADFSGIKLNCIGKIVKSTSSSYANSACISADGFTQQNTSTNNKAADNILAIGETLFDSL